MHLSFSAVRKCSVICICTSTEAKEKWLFSLSKPWWWKVLGDESRAYLERVFSAMCFCWLSACLWGETRILSVKCLRETGARSLIKHKQPFTPMGNLELVSWPNLPVFWVMGGNQCRQAGEHANFAEKCPSQPTRSNPETPCFEVTDLTTVPPYIYAILYISQGKSVWIHGFIAHLQNALWTTLLGTFNKKNQ